MANSASRLLCPILLSFFLFSCAGDPELSTTSYPLPQPEEAQGAERSLDSEGVKLAAGDVLRIDVWGQEDLSRDVSLDVNGNIYYPFIGRVDASGLTIDELSKDIAEKLSLYYVDPRVSIIPTNLSGQRYYVLGEVMQPGKLRIEAPTAVFEAVASAGGPSKDAADLVILLRKEEGALHVLSIPLKYRDLTEQNVHSVTMLLQSNDVLYLPPSNIADVQRFMIRLNDIISPILDIQRSVILWPELIDAINGTSSQILIP